MITVWKLIIDDFMAGLALKPGVLHRIQSSLSVCVIRPSHFILNVLSLLHLIHNILNLLASNGEDGHETRDCSWHI